MPASSDDPQYSELASNIVDSGNSKTMWATLGQRFNSAGIISTLGVMIREQHLALPHLSVPDIRWINWKELKKQGFQGIVFDKDNTLTAPYAPSLWPTLAASLEDCKSVFEGRIALLSNSAGTKKPAGTAKDIEKYFGSDPSLLVMVGDRHFTDIVYGNRNGFLTILTEPLTLAGEPFIVRQMDYINTSHPAFIGGSKAVEVALQQQRSTKVSFSTTKFKETADSDRVPATEKIQKSRALLAKTNASGAVPDQVNNAKRELHSVFIKKLYRENLFEEMLQEREEIAIKRKRCREILRVLQQAAWTLDELPLDCDIPSKGASTAVDATGLPRAQGLPPSMYGIASGEFAGVGSQSPSASYLGSPRNVKSRKSSHSGEQASSLNPNMLANGGPSSGSGAGYPAIDP